MKNDEEKTHPDLQPWEKLTDEEQEKDRGPMRRMPRILAEAEFQIVRTDGVQHDGSGIRA